MKLTLGFCLVAHGAIDDLQKSLLALGTGDLSTWIIE